MSRVSSRIQANGNRVKPGLNVLAFGHLDGRCMAAGRGLRAITAKHGRRRRRRERARGAHRRFGFRRFSLVIAFAPLSLGVMATLPAPHPRWEGGPIEDYDFSTAETALDIDGLKTFFNFDGAADDPAVIPAGDAKEEIGNADISKLVGSQVLLQNLNRQELNGERGTAVGFNETTGRVGVRLSLSGSTVWVKPANTIPYRDPKPKKVAKAPSVGVPVSGGEKDAAATPLPPAPAELPAPAAKVGEVAPAELPAPAAKPAQKLSKAEALAASRARGKGLADPAVRAQFGRVRVARANVLGLQVLELRVRRVALLRRHVRGERTHAPARPGFGLKLRHPRWRTQPGASFAGKYSPRFINDRHARTETRTRSSLYLRWYESDS